MKFRKKLLAVLVAIILAIFYIHAIIHRIQNRRTPLTASLARFIGIQEICPWVPRGLEGFLDMKSIINMPVPTAKDLDKIQTKPLGCKPRRNVAIIVPYRDRESQLRVFLRHMHPILQKQKLNYTIFIIEQADQLNFNRAKLLNVGFQEARKIAKFDCFFFHDVDILLENDRCLLCMDTATRHFATLINKFGYKGRIYGLDVCHGMQVHKFTNPLFGGIVRTNANDMITANGFSNEYWGWGAEDDDFYFRLKMKGVPTLVSDDLKYQCSYYMMNHSREDRNDTKDVLIKHAIGRMDVDGLNNLEYTVVRKTEGRLYTNISVDLGTPNPYISNFTTLMHSYHNKSCMEMTTWFKEEVFATKINDD